MAFGKPKYEDPPDDPREVAPVVPLATARETVREQHIESLPLPFDTDLQNACAFYAITDRDFCADVMRMGLTPDWFSSARTGVVVKALHEFIRDHGCHPRSVEELKAHPRIARNAEARDLEKYLAHIADESKRFSPEVLLSSIEPWRKARVFKEAVHEAVKHYNREAFDEAYSTLREGVESIASVARAPAGFAVPMSEVQQEVIDWVTPGWVVTGKLHLIEGDGGCGKSTVTLDAVACWSTGRGWLGGAPRPSAGCLILAPEDGAGDTIRPKLQAAGADLSRVYVQTMDAGVPVFPDIIPALESFITQHGIKFIVIDSLMSTLGEKNSHKDQDVRSALMPLVAMLERTGCTALAIRHLNKNVGASASQRGMGSVAFAAIARIVILCGKDPETPGQYVMSRSKGNLGRAPQSRTYALKGSTDTSTDVVVTWGLGTDLNADDIVAKPESQRGRPAGKRNEAEEFLKATLTPGTLMRKADVIRAADAKGFSESTIERAARSIGVTSQNGIWRLPHSMTEKVDAVLDAAEARHE